MKTTEAVEVKTRVPRTISIKVSTLGYFACNGIALLLFCWVTSETGRGQGRMVAMMFAALIAGLFLGSDINADKGIR